MFCLYSKEISLPCVVSSRGIFVFHGKVQESIKRQMDIIFKFYCLYPKNKSLFLPSASLYALLNKLH